MKKQKKAKKKKERSGLYEAGSLPFSQECRLNNEKASQNVQILLFCVF